VAVKSFLRVEGLDQRNIDRVAQLWEQRLKLEQKLGLHTGNEKDFHSRRAQYSAALVTMALKCTGLYNWGRRNALHPVRKDHGFSFPGLPPALDGLTLLHLSDFHFSDSDPEFTEAAAALVRGEETDLCVLTGDYRYGYYGPQEGIKAHLQRVLSGIHARYGVFAVLGNHDLSTVVPLFRELGVQLLVNDGRLLNVRDEKIWIGGVDDPHKFRADSLEDAMAGAPDDAFKLLLAHSPEIIPEAADLGVDLYLCGHTHGGQVRLPYFGAIYANARCESKYAGGVWRYGAMHGYTTWGMGVTDLPVRYFCPAEALHITLRRG
jgi:uncharacterized protein